jgi:hypothetical protein
VWLTLKTTDVWAGSTTYVSAASDRAGTLISQASEKTKPASVRAIMFDS